jgi:hypothetical protein
MALKPELSSELRTMVREVLREAMAGKVAPALAAVESVKLCCDTDLAAFVARLLDPAMQERVKAGKLRFTLGASPQAAAATGAILTGVISEKTIDRNASAGTLVLAADAVLTPLARDRARQLKLKIERRR